LQIGSADKSDKYIFSAIDGLDVTEFSRAFSVF